MRVRNRSDVGSGDVASAYTIIKTDFSVAFCYAHSAERRTLDVRGHGPGCAMGSDRVYREVALLRRWSTCLTQMCAELM